mgnify:CR=1 FL=1
MKTLIFTLAFLCLATTLSAQQVTYTTYDLDTVINDPTLQQFAELEDGTAYMYYRYFASGQRDVAMLEFDGAAWSPIDTLCRSCVRHIVAGPDGMLYVAAGNEGIYRRANDAWEQVVTEDALHLAFSPDGILHFINIDGVFTFDGSTVAPGNVTGRPDNLNSISVMKFRDDGTLFFIRPGTLYSYTETDGFTTQSQIVSPLHLAGHPDGSMYVADNFGQIGIFRADGFENNAVRGVFTSGIGLNSFDISSDGVLWGSQQGFSAGVLGYNDPRTTEVLEPSDLIPNAILINKLYAGAGGRVYASSDLRPAIAIIQDELTSVFSANRTFLPMTISPNPASGSLLVELELPGNSSGHIYIRDINGRTLRTLAVSGTGHVLRQPVSLRGLKAAVYLVEARFDGAIGTSRLVIR